MDNKRPVILIVEDDEPSYLYLESILKQIPVTVLRVENGRKAVNLCGSGAQVSLILMDLKMPVMDGLDATRKIKTINPGLPIIVITAYAFSGDEKIAVDAGCDEYLTKPVKKELLFKKLEAYGIQIT